MDFKFSDTIGPTTDGNYPNLMQRPRLMRAHNAVAKAVQWIRRYVTRFDDWLQDREWHHSYCNDCGEATYYGRTCRQVLGPLKGAKERELP